MTKSLAEPTAENRRPSRMPLVGRAWYMAAVLAMAIFMLGLWALHTPGTGFTSQARLAIQSPAGAEAAAAEASELAKKITGNGEIVRAAAGAGLPGFFVNQGEIDVARIIAVRQRLSVVTGTGNLPGEALVSLVYTGNSSDEALGLLEQLTKQAIADHTRQQAMKAATLKATLETARGASIWAKRSHEQAEQAVATFDRQYATELAAPPSPAAANAHVTESKVATEKEPEPDSPALAPADRPKTPVVKIKLRPRQIANPQLMQIQKQLAELREEREKLLDRLMPEHPEVVALVIEINDLREKMATLPTMVDDPKDPQPASDSADDGGDAEGKNSTPAEQPPAKQVPTKQVPAKRDTVKPSSAQPAAIDPAVKEKLLAQRVELVQQRDDAAAAVLRADAELARSEQAFKAAQNSKLKTLSVPYLSETPVSGMTGGRTLGLLAGSLAIGIACTFLVVRGRKPITSEQEIVRATGMPVMGTLALPGGTAAAPLPTRWQRGIGVGVRIGEVVLAAVVILTVLAIVTDSGYVGRLAASPIDGLCEAFDRVRG